MSSIFKIIRTHSVARVIALVLTSKGCTTFSSKMLVICPFLTLIPALISPCACLLRSSVTITIGFKPAFSANVYGTTSSASAKDLTQNPSIPCKTLDHAPS
ncbi:hypothetical protein HanRHA438_Chr13g0579511 [Helianthus annuus]|nr:hypothetical protein HanRHA438_Chr13g0579511 [Helianthus annuus]